MKKRVRQNDIIRSGREHTKDLPTIQQDFRHPLPDEIDKDFSKVSHVSISGIKRMPIQRYVQLSVDRLLDKDFRVQKRLLAYLKKHEMDMLKFKTTASLDLPGWRKLIPGRTFMKLADFFQKGI